MPVVNSPTIRRLALSPMTVFIALAVVYISTATYGGNVSRDTFTASVAAWALGVHHTLNLGAFGSQLGSSASLLWVAHGSHGSFVSNRFPGAVLLAAPFYAVFGGSKFTFMPATICAGLAAAAAGAVLYKVLLHFESRRIAFLATLLFGFATANWTVSGRELWEHPGAELAVAAGMLAAIRRRWTLSGLAFGAAVLFRPHLGLGGAAVGLGLIWVESRWQPTLRFALGAVPGVVAFFVWNWVAYGRLTIEGGYQGISPGGMGVLGFLEGVAGTLVSPERGVLVCSPVFVVAIFGLRPAWQTSSRLARVFCCGGLVYLASQLWLIRFSGGNGFIGYRVCLESIVWCAPVLVRAGAIGVGRVGSALTWLLVGASAAFFASGAFVQGEWSGNTDPWTTWTPILIARQYGLFNVLFGALIGLGGAFVAWGLLRRVEEREEVRGIITTPAADPLPSVA